LIASFTPFIEAALKYIIETGENMNLISDRTLISKRFTCLSAPGPTNSDKINLSIIVPIYYLFSLFAF